MNRKQESRPSSETFLHLRAIVCIRSLAQLVSTAVSLKANLKEIPDLSPAKACEEFEHAFQWGAQFPWVFNQQLKSPRLAIRSSNLGGNCYCPAVEDWKGDRGAEALLTPAVPKSLPAHTCLRSPSSLHPLLWASSKPPNGKTESAACRPAHCGLPPLSSKLPSLPASALLPQPLEFVFSKVVSKQRDPQITIKTL